MLDLNKGYLTEDIEVMRKAEYHRLLLSTILKRQLKFFVHLMKAGGQRILNFGLKLPKYGLLKKSLKYRGQNRRQRGYVKGRITQITAQYNSQ